MAEPFLGQVSIFGFNYAPYQWAFCNGQLMQITQYSALFALLGTQFGGNGTSNFNLPNLQGRMPIHFGTNAGHEYRVGDAGGNSMMPVSTTTSFTLGINNLPSHTHTATLSLPAFDASTRVSVSSTAASGQTTVPAEGSTLTNSPSGGQTSAAVYLPRETQQSNPVNLGGVTTTVTPSGSGSVANANTGGGQAVNAPLNFTVPTMPPYLALNFCIALFGQFPSRN